MARQASSRTELMATSVTDALRALAMNIDMFTATAVSDVCAPGAQGHRGEA